MSKITLDIADNIARLTIQSPPANALSSSLIKQIDEHLDKIEQDETVKAVILKGEGKFFSAGADIKEFTDMQEADDYEVLAKVGQDVFGRMEKFHIPIIAAIHGAALGGGLELALGCHIRIVTEDAKIGLPELNLGIIPGFAGTQRLPRLVGAPKAIEMLLTGEPISGKEAHQYGLANHAVKEDELFTLAETLTKKFVAKSKPTISQVMHLVRSENHATFEDGVKAEAKAFGQVFGNEDATEGIQAFLEKRPAKFTDK